MRHSLLAACFLAGACSVVPSQDMAAQDQAKPDNVQDSASLIAKLRSGNPRVVACAAELVGRQGLRQAIPELLRTIERFRTDSGLPGRLVCLHASDALVGLGAELSAAQARALDTEDALIPSLVLLSRSPDRHLEQLRTLHDAAETGIQGDVWRATGNLLAGVKAPGFAAKLVRDLGLELEITVVNPGQDPPVQAVGVGLGGSGGSFSSSPGPRGFPRMPCYELRRVPEAGDVVLAPGKNPVYYRRTLSPPGRYADGYASDTYRSDLTRLAWLETMAEASAKPLGFRLSSRKRIEFRGGESYRRSVESSRSALERGFHSMVSRLAAKKALTPREQAVSRPEIKLEIQDARDPWQGRLPSLAKQR